MFMVSKTWVLFLLLGKEQQYITVLSLFYVELFLWYIIEGVAQ